MSRDGSGNYTLPVGNPVVSGTIIDVNWANSTMSDIAQQLNNVITRDGALGPLVPVASVDGTEALPGMSFKLATGTGLWREAARAGYSYNGTAAWYKNATGLVIPSNVLVNSINSGPLAGFRNRIINGNFKIDQRLNLAAATITAGNSAFVGDHWLVNNQSNQTVIAQIVAGQNVIGASDLDYRLRLSCPVAPSLGVVYVSQKIEGVETLANTTSVFSIYMACGSAESVQAFVAQNFGSGGSTSVQSNVVATNLTVPWTRFSAALTIPSVVGKTSGAGNNLEAVLAVYIRSVNAVSLAYAQLEPGTVATPFEFRPYGVELALCQRYYQVIYGGQLFGIATGANTISTGAALPVQLRIGATVRTLLKTAYTGGLFELLIGTTWVTNASAAFVSSAAENTNFIGSINGFTGLTAGQMAYFNSNTVPIVSVSSEL